MKVRVGIVGVGVAGRARARALADHPDATLVGVHRGRFAAETGAPVLDGDALLAACELVIVASPSDTHEAWVARALDAGRDVIVEYPLARTAAAARRLFDRARAEGRLLHVEHIGRLAPGSVWLADVAAREGWVSGEVVFHAGGAPWPDGPTHAWQTESRWHRVVQVFGWPATVEVTEADGARLSAVATWGDGRTVWLHTSRGEGTRGLDLTLRTAGGSVCRIVGRGAVGTPGVGGPPTRHERDGVEVVLPSRGLFRADLDAALGRLRGDPQGRYVTDDEIVAVLDLCERTGAVGRVARSNALDRP